MKRIYLFCIITAICLSSCTESSVIGEDFVKSSDIELERVSSIPLAFSTIKFDSLPTNDLDRLVVGARNDTPFGDITIESYFLIYLITSEYVSGLQYDSLTLSLPMDGYSTYLSEETVNQTITLEQLSNELEYRDDFNLYNFSEIPGITDQDGEVIAEKEFFWEKDRVRELEMRLPDALGQDLFDKLEDGDEIFTYLGEGNEYLKGFRLSMKNASFAVGFDQDSIKLTIHATDNSTPISSQVSYDFYISGTPNYTKYTQQDIPEDLDIKALDEEVLSDELDDYSYICSGLGYASKIDLANIRDILLSGSELILADAELKIRWFESSLDENPETLSALLVDKDFNDLTGQTFLFNKEEDDEYGRENYYSLDATSIANYILDESIDQEFYLIITMDEYANSFNSIILGDQSLTSELIIYTIKN